MRLGMLTSFPFPLPSTNSTDTKRINGANNFLASFLQLFVLVYDTLLFFLFRTGLRGYFQRSKGSNMVAKRRGQDPVIFTTALLEVAKKG